MRYLRNLSILALAVLAFTFTDASAQSYSVNGKKPNQGIERQVYKEIITLPYFGVFDNIAYKVDGDTVTLYGKVVQPTTKSSAGKVVERIAGVEEVINNIEVLPLSNFDDSIRLRTLRTLQNGGSLGRYFASIKPSIKIIVERGNITLEGFVANRGDYNLANVLANGVSGAFSVNNHLIVEKEMVR